MSHWKEPTLIFERKQFRKNDYIYILKDDPNLSSDDREIWIYIEIKGFYMKKLGRVLTIGNYNGDMFTLTGYSTNMANNWANKIRKTIGFP